MDERRNRSETTLFDELLVGQAKQGTTVYSRRQKGCGPRQPLQQKLHNELSKVKNEHPKSKEKTQPSWVDRNSGFHLLHRRGEQHRQSWLNRSLSLRRRSSIVYPVDASSVSASAHSSVVCEAAEGVSAPCGTLAHRRKKNQAPAPREYVAQQQAVFAEIDAFELEESIPSPVHARGWVDGNFDFATVGLTTSFHPRYAPLEAVPEDTSPSSYVLSRTKHMLAAALGTPPLPCTKPEASTARGSLMPPNNGSHNEDLTLDCAQQCCNTGHSRGTPISTTQARPISLSRSSKVDGATRDAGSEDDPSSPFPEYLSGPRRLSFNSLRQQLGFTGERGELIQERRNRQASVKSPLQGFTPANHMGAVIADFGALNIGGRLLNELDTSYAAILEEDEFGPAEILTVPAPTCNKTLEASIVQGGKFSSVFQGLLEESGQVELLSQEEAISSYCNLSRVTKIGEGTFGEAFKEGDTVLKIVPVDGDFRVNGELQKTASELYDEVLLSSTLNKLRLPGSSNFCSNFITTKGIKFCRGKYDANLVQAWEEWDSEHTSENDHPMIFPEHQLYVVFILADGGKDLESFAIFNFEEVQSVLLQIVLSLAVAESACEFEHRDLHWGNVVLARKQDGSGSYSLDGKQVFIRTYGLFVSIIDFTLSRVNTGKQVLFCNLGDDSEVFSGQARDIQSDTYRGMFKITRGLWEGRFPKTNVLWIHYLTAIIMKKKSFSCNAKQQRDLRSFSRRVLHYDSARAAASDEFFDNLRITATQD